MSKRFWQSILGIFVALLVICVYYVFWIGAQSSALMAICFMFMVAGGVSYIVLGTIFFLLCKINNKPVSLKTISNY